MPTRKIYTNTIAQIGAKVLTALISIVMIKILTNYLDVAGYGLYSKIYNYLSIFAVIADLGLYTITVRELSANKDDPRMVDKIASNVLTLRTLSGALIIIFSLGIGFFTPGYNSPEAMIGIAIASIFTLFGLINSSLMSYLQSILRTEFSLVANTAGKLLTLGMIILFASAAWGATHTDRFTLVMIAGLAGNALMTALTWWYTQRWYPVRFWWDLTYIRHILITSLPYWLALFLNVIFFKVDVILLSIMEPRDIADSVIALYSLPMKIVEVGMLYGTVFLNSLLPVLTGMIETRQYTKAKTLIKKSFLLLFSAWLTGSLIVFFSGEWILRLISKREFLETRFYGFGSVEAFHIVWWIFLVYFVSSLCTYILIAYKAEKKMLVINSLVAVVNIIGNLILIPRYSFIGSAWATLGSQILLVILTGYAAYRTWKK
jgi:O-antigen/teichoic acid export membrane protein